MIDLRYLARLILLRTLVVLLALEGALTLARKLGVEYEVLRRVDAAHALLLEAVRERVKKPSDRRKPR